MKKMKNQWEKYKEEDSNIFRDIPGNISKDSYEASSQRRLSYKEDHKCIKASREDETEVTSLTYDKIIKLSVKISKYNGKL